MNRISQICIASDSVVTPIENEGIRMILAFGGIVIGLGASFALTRALSSLLFGVSATNPLTFAAVAILVLLVALLACYLPARRPMRTEPLTALCYQ